MHLGAAGCDSLIFWLPLTFARRENELTSCVDSGHWAILHIMSVVVAALVSTRCRMDTKRSRLKKNDQQPAAASFQSLSSSRSTRKPGCYWALIQNLRQSSFDFKTCLPVISTPSAPTDPGQRQVWEKLNLECLSFPAIHISCTPLVFSKR